MARRPSGPTARILPVVVASIALTLSGAALAAPPSSALPRHGVPMVTMAPTMRGNAPAAVTTRDNGSRDGRLRTFFRKVFSPFRRDKFTPQRQNVTNETLHDFVAHEKDVLEVIVPANKGHVYYRVGEKVYDFFTPGLRVGGVRPIGGDRYGFLVRLSPSQMNRLRGELERLERTNGAELGTYDFTGKEGLHCVSWFARLPLGDNGENVVQLLGGTPEDGKSMPSFSRFLAGHVTEQVVYSQKPMEQRKVDKMRLQLMNQRELREAFAGNGQ